MVFNTLITKLKSLNKFAESFRDSSTLPQKRDFASLNITPILQYSITPTSPSRKVENFQFS